MKLYFLCSLPEEQKEVRQQQEKLVLQEECELITVMEVIKGRLEVTTSHIYFFDCTPNKEEGMCPIRFSTSFKKVWGYQSFARDQRHPLFGLLVMSAVRFKTR